MTNYFFSFSRSAAPVLPGQLSRSWWWRIVLLAAFLACLRKNFLDRSDTRQHRRRFDWHKDDLGVVCPRHIAKALDVTSRDEILRRVPVLLHGFSDPRDSFCFRFGL